MYNITARSVHMEIGQLAAKPASQVWIRLAGHAAMQ